LTNSSACLPLRSSTHAPRSCGWCETDWESSHSIYYSQKHLFLFASEIKAILPAQKVSPTVDQNALADYLTYGFVPGRKTLFENIFILEPGCYLKYEGCNFEIVRYWSLPVHRSSSAVPEVSDNDFMETLRTATSDRMLSDVPLGSFLSGGNDSSVVTAILADSLGAEPQLQTFASASIKMTVTMRDNTRNSCPIILRQTTIQLFARTIMRLKHYQNSFGTWMNR